MAKLGKLAAFMTSKFGTKFEADAGDEKVKEALHSKMEEDAAAATMDEAFAYDEKASNLEEMAKLYEEAHPEPDGDEPAHVTMRRMAAKFKRMAKGGNSEGPPGGLTPGEPAMEEDDKATAAFAQSLGIDPRGKTRAQLFDAIKAGVMPTSKVPELIAAQVKDALAAEKAAQAKLDNGKRAATLMSRLPATYPGDRAALGRLAERDPDEAEKLAAPFLPHGPAHLFDRHSQNGGPLGGPTSGLLARGDSAAPGKPRRVQAMGRTFIEDDHDFAAEVMRLAESQDAAEKAKIDKYIHESRRTVKFDRLMAAEKVVRAERPDLAEAADNA